MLILSAGKLSLLTHSRPDVQMPPLKSQSSSISMVPFCNHQVFLSSFFLLSKESLTYEHTTDTGFNSQSEVLFQVAAVPQ